MFELAIVACAAGILLVRIGLALYTCGLVRAKNAGGALLRHVADLCLAALVFWLVGMAILDPVPRFETQKPLIRWSNLMGLGAHEWRHMARAVFVMLTTTLLASGIVVGALSERTRFWPSLAPGMLLAGIVTPLLARWAQGGWLWQHFHFHDLAGASYVHVAAGATAAIGAIVVGPRGGKYNRDGSSNVIPGHNLPLAGSGALLMLVGWFAYLASFSTYQASIVATNALLAAAAAGAASLAVAQIRYGKPDIYLTLTGVLGGLVSITAGADALNTPAAVLTGAIAGVLISLLLLQLDLVWKVDDPTGAVAIHGVGGIWGLLATGLFGEWEGSGGWFRRVGAQCVGLLVAAAVAAIAAALLLIILKKCTALRSLEEHEFDGLDLAEHDIGSYPDFQQTMIKSYHLREA
jgi:Amt family ammonium transporter